MLFLHAATASLTQIHRSIPQKPKYSSFTSFYCSFCNDLKSLHLKAAYYFAIQIYVTMNKAGLLLYEMGTHSKNKIKLSLKSNLHSSPYGIPHKWMWEEENTQETREKSSSLPDDLCLLHVTPLPAATPGFRSHWKLLQNRGAFQHLHLLLLADLVATQLHKSSSKSFLYVSLHCCSEWLLMLSFSIQNFKFLKCHSVC